MSILEHEVRSATGEGFPGLHRHLITREVYLAMAESGAFINDRIELIEGEIIEMAPIGDEHAAITQPLALILQDAFGPGFTVRNQVPITIGDNPKPSVPQPDIAVVAGSWREYLKRKPGSDDIKLLVEIADSTLAKDRKIKGVLYAAAGIPEYWIVNLVEMTVEVYTAPAEAGYGSLTIRRSGDTIKPNSPQAAIVAVADFMP